MICAKLFLLITAQKEPYTMVKLDYFFEAVVNPLTSYFDSYITDTCEMTVCYHYSHTDKLNIY